MGMLKGKTGIVFGVANNRSIAWSIAQTLHKEGMRLAFTYQGERLRKQVEELTSTIPNSLLLPCDVTSDEEIIRTFEAVDAEFGRLDVLVHSVAFAPAKELEDSYHKTSREGYRIAQDISSYSLVGLTRAAMPLFEKAGGGSVITMTYLGATRAIPGYNVMGVAKAALESSVRYLAAELGAHNIRVNAISAGPVKTLAARGIKGFSRMMRKHEDTTPMKRNVTLKEIANAALFLASDMSTGITGDIMFVDCGYHMMAV